MSCLLQVNLSFIHSEPVLSQSVNFFNWSQTSKDTPSPRTRLHNNPIHTPFPATRFYTHGTLVSPQTCPLHPRLQACAHWPSCRWGVNAWSPFVLCTAPLCTHACNMCFTLLVAHRLCTEWGPTARSDFGTEDALFSYSELLSCRCCIKIRHFREICITYQIFLLDAKPFLFHSCPWKRKLMNCCFGGYLLGPLHAAYVTSPLLSIL